MPCFCFEVVLITQHDEYQVFRRKVKVHIKNMIKFDINTTRNRNTSYGRLEKHLSVNNAMEIPNQKSSRGPRHLATLFLLNCLLSFFFMMITVIYTQMFFYLVFPVRGSITGEIILWPWSTFYDRSFRTTHLCRPSTVKNLMGIKPLDGN